MYSFLVPRRLSRPSLTLYSRAGTRRVHDFLIFVFPPYSWCLVALAFPPHLPNPPSLKFRRKALFTYSLCGLIYVFWQCHGEDWKHSPCSLLLKYLFIKRGEGSDKGENENGDYRAGEPNFNRVKLILFLPLLSFTWFPIVTWSSASDSCSMTEISRTPLRPFPPPMPLPPFFIIVFMRELGCLSLLSCRNGYVLWLAFRSWNRKCFIGSQRINMKCRP